MGKRRVLIVDDEHLTRISLADFLEDTGYMTVIAEDGETAIQLQCEHPFDVCIVDIRMPGIDGIETIMELHQISQNTHFIICTGSPQFTLPPALKKLRIPAACVIHKPVLDMKIFAKLIEQITDSPYS